MSLGGSPGATRLRTRGNVSRNLLNGSCCLLAAIGVMAIDPRPAAAYRTAAEFPEFNGQAKVMWDDPDVRFALDVDSRPSGLSRDEVVEAFEVALQTWAAPECSHAAPRLEGVANAEPMPMDRQNTVVWVTNWSDRGFDHDAASTTHVQYVNDGGTWQVGEADIYLNAEHFEWSIGDADNRRDVVAVLTHEVGHALGLLHPCEPDGATGAPKCEREHEGTTMYPIYDAAQASLADDDVAGICYLYGGEAGDCGACDEGRICVNGDCMAPCRGDWCDVGSVCGARGCVPEGACTESECVGQACERDDDCGPVADCEASRCVRGTARIGASCRRSPDCAEGVCTDGRCEPECFSEGACGASGDCIAAVEPGLLGCKGSGRYPFGAECTVGEDCTSGICAHTPEGDLCTVTCGQDSQCEPGHSCEEVEGSDVCVPRVFAPSGGCSTSHLPANAPSAAWMHVVWVVAVLIGTRRQMQGKSQ